MKEQLVILISAAGKDVAHYPTQKDLANTPGKDWAIVYENGQFRRIFAPEQIDVETLKGGPAFPFIKKQKSPL